MIRENVWRILAWRPRYGKNLVRLVPADGPKRRTNGLIGSMVESDPHTLSLLHSSSSLSGITRKVVMVQSKGCDPKTWPDHSLTAIQAMGRFAGQC